MIRVEVVLAWPDQVLQRTLELAENATVAEAIRAAALPGTGGHPAVAIHGQVVQPPTVLQDGDRVELLRPLLADPKDSRRRRAKIQRG